MPCRNRRVGICAFIDARYPSPIFRAKMRSKSSKWQPAAVQSNAAGSATSPLPASHPFALECSSLLAALIAEENSISQCVLACFQMDTNESTLEHIDELAPNTRTGGYEDFEVRLDNAEDADARKQMVCFAQQGSLLLDLGRKRRLSRGG